MSGTEISQHPQVKVIREALESAREHRDYLTGDDQFEALVLRHLDVSDDYGQPMAPLHRHNMVYLPKAHEVERLILGSKKLNGHKDKAIQTMQQLSESCMQDTDSQNTQDLKKQLAAFYMIAKDHELADVELQGLALDAIQSYMNHIVTESMLNRSFISGQRISYTDVKNHTGIIGSAQVAVVLGGDNQFSGIFHQLQRAGIDQDIHFLPLNSDYEFSRGAMLSAPAIFWPIIQRKLEQGAYRVVEFPLISVIREMADPEGTSTRDKCAGVAMSELYIGASDRNRITKCRIQVFDEDDIRFEHPIFDERQEGSGLLVANILGITGWIRDSGKDDLNRLIIEDGLVPHPHTTMVSPLLYVHHSESGVGHNTTFRLRPGQVMRVTIRSDSESYAVFDSHPDLNEIKLGAGARLRVTLDPKRTIKIIRFNDWMNDPETAAWYAEHGRELMRRAF